MKAFLTRLTSVILLLVIIGVTCAFGSWPLWIAVTLAGFIGLHEFYRVLEIPRGDTLWWIGMIGAGMWSFISFVVCGGDPAWKENLWLTLVAAFMLIMLEYVISYPKCNTQQIMAAFFGIFYVPVMLSFIYQTRMLEDGFQLVWLIFLSAWGCDTCAYCTGVLIGKHKMAPKLSPKKSIEGGIGGLAGAALLGALYALAINKWGGASAGVGEYALICFVGGIISMIGDLAASAIKRNHEIKDYGKLIPGHGGILDRFDSVIVTAPMIYVLALRMLG